MEVLHLPVDHREYAERRQQLALGRELLALPYQDMAALLEERSDEPLDATLLADMERGFALTPASVSTANLSVINETIAEILALIRAKRERRQDPRWPLKQQDAG